MKRNLITQMRNEWRENIWLIIEFAVVLTVVWLLATALYGNLRGLFYPKGFNPVDVYTISVNYLDESSPEFVDPGEEDLKQLNFDDLMELRKRISENPNVDAIVFQTNFVPYNLSYWGSALKRTDPSDSILYNGNFRYAEPDIIKVLDIKSKNGVSQERLIEMLKDGEILISDNAQYEKDGRNTASLIGEKVFRNVDTTKLYRVGDLVWGVRRSDYELSDRGVVIMPVRKIRPGNSYEIILKVKPGKGKSFMEDFKNNPTLRKQRNVILSDLTALTDIAETTQRPQEVDIRVWISAILVLLFTIFLGLLGTFWFRVQQRVGEIAIRKVCGASRADIFRRLISEGLMLLIISALIVSAIIWPFSDKLTAQLLQTDMMIMTGITELPASVLLSLEITSVVIVGIGITLSLLYPAYRAMKINPAEAVKSE